MPYTLAGEDPDLTAAIAKLKDLAEADGIELGESDAQTAIPRLLQASRPAAIARLVIAVVFDALKRQADRLLAHIFQKGGEVVTPTVTHSDAPGTVAVESRIGGVVAPPFCVEPGRIRSRTVVVTVSSRCVAKSFALETPAALRVAGAKVRRCYDRFAATDAPTVPRHASLLTSIGALFKYSQPPKHSPSKRDHLHGGIYHPNQQFAL